MHPWDTIVEWCDYLFNCWGIFTGCCCMDLWCWMRRQFVKATYRYDNILILHIRWSIGCDSIDIRRILSHSSQLPNHLSNVAMVSNICLLCCSELFQPTKSPVIDTVITSPIVTCNLRRLWQYCPYDGCITYIYISEYHGYIWMLANEESTRRLLYMWLIFILDKYLA